MNQKKGLGTAGLVVFLLTCVVITAEYYYDRLELVKAIVYGYEFRVKAIIESDPGALNRLDENGFTPLDIAVFLRDPAMAQFLLENGADFYQLNQYGDTALDIARGACIGACRVKRVYPNCAFRAVYDVLCRWKERTTVPPGIPAGPPDPWYEYYMPDLNHREGVPEKAALVFFVQNEPDPAARPLTYQGGCFVQSIGSAEFLKFGLHPRRKRRGIRPDTIKRDYPKRDRYIEGFFSSVHRDFQNLVRQFEDRAGETADFISKNKRMLVFALSGVEGLPFVIWH